MRHVAAHRWADVFAGRVNDATRAKLEAHADACARCAATRARIAAARETFAPLRDATAPELPWDEIRARVHWSVSSEQRARERRHTGSQPVIDRASKTGPFEPVRGGDSGSFDRLPVRRGDSGSFDRLPAIPARRRWPLVVGAFAATGAAAALAVHLWHPASPDRVAVLPADAAARAALAPDAAPAPVKQLAAIINRAGGDVLVDGERADFARALVAGDVIATGEGRLDLQFGPASALSLSPHSTVELHRFDSAMIDLVVDGTVDIEVGPRAADQRFVVHAGGRDVEVRGTQFRVVHDASATTVSCRHGVVAVRDGASAPATTITNAQRVSVANGKPLADQHVAALTAEELDTLVLATPYALPVWSDVVTRSSTTLELRGTRDVRVDGIEHGVAPLHVRVLPGRHTIEAAERDGRFRRVGFIDASPDATATFALPAIAAATPSIDLRPRMREFHAGLDRVRLARCFRELTKTGTAPTSIDVELVVDANGAINAANVDTDLSSRISSCVHDVVAAVTFAPGVAASWHDKIEL